jgi:putative membrane-bound dehydrogenase-like protein
MDDAEEEMTAARGATMADSWASRRRRVSAAAVVLAALGSVALGTAADDFPKPYDSEKSAAKPLAPADAARGFRVPPGFSVAVFAAEPEVRNPSALAWDGRGRLWVAESYTYAEPAKKFDLNLRDRVLVFADRDGDGRPDERTVFLDSVQRLTSVEVGLGGVWLMCPPQLLFVPDRDGDDKPDGPPEVVLEGFDIPPENYHNFAYGLRWGPDGWLYGRCGASAPGKVRRPDRLPETAVPLAGGVWRYHPTRKMFEPLAHGTTNPWGHDWNEHGEGFFVNSVNGHLWHLIPGAHFRRPHTLSPNPLVYEPMEMHADHWHWDTGKDWTDSRSAAGEHDRLGGGHAHSGAMVYLGGQWPAAFRGRLLTFNLHGRRANVERLERSGSGYVGRREPDTLFAADPFFRGIDLSYGPDGTVFVLDWSDTGECHEHTGVHRSSGRIYAVRYGTPPAIPAPDLRALAGERLVALHASGNEWFVRQARRELANRSAAGKALDAERAGLLDLLKRSADGAVRLRALWTLHTLGAASPELLRPLLDDADEHVRAWAVRLLTDSWPLDTVLGAPRAEGVTVPADLLDRFARMARADGSGLVRLVLASTLQRLPVAHRPALAAALLSRGEDAADSNLPFLVWYGLIPVAEKDPQALVALAADGRFPRVREWVARRFAEVLAKHPAALDALLARTRDRDEAVRRNVVTGMTAGLAGVRKAIPPPAWQAFAKEFTGPDADRVRSLVRGLDVVFGDGRALEEVRRLALDGQADLRVRKAALQTLIEAKPADLRTVCETLLKVRFLNTVALQGLVRFDDPAVGKLIARSYRTFHPTERPAVVEALASRPGFAGELLELVAAGTVPRSELSAFQARQVRGFDRPELTKRLAEVWGELRDSPQDKAEAIARLKSDLTPARLAAADKPRGRAVFAQACANCHRLFGAGAEVGPDLTGSGRKDLDYLLSNIVDPSAVVTKDFQLTVLALADGRAVNGVVVAETDKALTVQTAQDRVAIPKEDVVDRTRSAQSLMPDGLLQPLNAEQVRDLIAYLMADAQVDLPPDAKSGTGKDGKE